MPRGSKDKYTEKQKRKAEHIEESYEEKGVSKDEAQARARATVNKTSGGGERSGSGTRKPAQQKRKDASQSARQAVATRRGEPGKEELVVLTGDPMYTPGEVTNERVPLSDIWPSGSRR